jgi:hypothetical protein
MTVQEVKTAVIKFLRTAAALAAASGAGILFVLALMYGRKKRKRAKEDCDAEKGMASTDTAARGTAHSAEDERKRAGIKEKLRDRMRAVCTEHLERSGSGKTGSGTGGRSGKGG